MPAESAKFLTSLAEADELPDEVVIHAMLLARDIHAEYAEIAESIIQGSSTYLPPILLEKLVRADISDDDATKHIQRNRAFFKRMTILLPSTLRLLQDRRPDSVLGALRLLDDCHHDYLAISSNPRRDRAKKQLLRLFDEVNFDLKRVIDHLEHLAPYVDLDFDQAYAIRFGGDKEYARRGEFDRFRRVLELMLDSFEVSRYRIRSDAPFPYLPHNQKRMHVVECAYALSEYWGGPKYVTTPGSDFSLLCSFLNEMISGTRDESMSGAIARFARQKAAQTITPESLGLGPDEDDTHPFDEDRLHWALIAFANFLSVSNAPDVSPSAKYIAMHMAHREAVRAVSSDKTKKKPDEAQGDVTTRMELISRLEGEMRASTIALGRLRRHQDD